MKRLFLTLCLGALSSIVLIAQDSEIPAFQMNKHYVSAGIGTGNFAQTFFRLILNANEESTAGYTSVGPLFFKYEYAISDHFGIGINVANITNKVSYAYDNSGQTYNAQLTCNGYSILARANYHFVNKKVIDPYIGLGLGYKGYKFTYTDNNSNNNGNATNTLNKAINSLPSFPLGMELTFGFRVMPTNVIGFYMETGLAKGIIQGGLSAKF